MSHEWFSSMAVSTLRDLMEQYGLEARTPDDATAKFSRRDIEVIVSKERGSNYVGLLIWVAPLGERYILPEIASWAKVEVPSTIARTPQEERSAVEWLKSFLREACAPLLTGSYAAFYGLAKAVDLHNEKYTRGMQLKSAKVRADMAARRGAFHEVVTLLEEWEAELDEHYAAALSDARRILSDPRDAQQ